MTEIPKRIGVSNQWWRIVPGQCRLRGVRSPATNRNGKVFASVDGFEGLLPRAISSRLRRPAPAGIMQLGGTIIGTTNRGHFVAKVAKAPRRDSQGNHRTGARDPAAAADRCRDRHRGDGSLHHRQQLWEAGIPMIGVPKTIDNDWKPLRPLSGSTAGGLRADAAGSSAHHRSSHKRAMVIEVMGATRLDRPLRDSQAAPIYPHPGNSFDHERVAQAVRKRDAMAASAPSSWSRKGQGKSPGNSVRDR